MLTNQLNNLFTKVKIRVSGKELTNELQTLNLLKISQIYLPGKFLAYVIVQQGRTNPTEFSGQTSA